MNAQARVFGLLVLVSAISGILAPFLLYFYWWNAPGPLLDVVISIIVTSGFAACITGIVCYGLVAVKRRRHVDNNTLILAADRARYIKEGLISQRRSITRAEQEIKDIEEYIEKNTKGYPSPAAGEQRVNDKKIE